MSAAGRARRRTIKQAEAALADAEHLLELALMRIRAANWSDDEEPEPPRPPPESPVVHH